MQSPPAAAMRVRAPCTRTRASAPFACTVASLALTASLLASVGPTAAAADAATRDFQAAQPAVSFHGQFFSGASTNANGTAFLNRLDQARRMFAAGDTELQTLTGVYDSAHFGLAEGAQWVGKSAARGPQPRQQA